jgi:hypothetical protein
LVKWSKRWLSHLSTNFKKWFKNSLGHPLKPIEILPYHSFEEVFPEKSRTVKELFSWKIKKEKQLAQFHWLETPLWNFRWNYTRNLHLHVLTFP